MKYLLKKYKIFIIIVGIINITILVLGVTRTNKSLTLKGNTSDVNSVIEIDADYKQEGSISSIFVESINKSTILMNIYADLSIRTDKQELSETYSSFTDKELQTAGLIQYQSALDISVIIGFLAAKSVGENFNIDYSFKSLGITYVSLTSPFKIGDFIVGINGIMVSDDLEGFANAFNNRKDKDIVNVIRDGVSIEVEISDETKNAFYGYKLYNIDYETISPSIRFNYANVLGPSGGLLQTLSIFNRLTETDYTHGKKISGTGTIDIDGSVGAIGGVAQKIYTAFDDNVDIFFCPESNYEEALEAYNKLYNKERMQLVSVKTFSDAVGYLNNV